MSKKLNIRYLQSGQKDYECWNVGKETFLPFLLIFLEYYII